MAFTVSGGFHYAPYKFIIYGPEGIGKTSFAAQFPDPVFIDTEGSTRYYDVKRITGPSGNTAPSSWQQLMDMVTAVKNGEIPCKTLVIDSLDWAETICSRHVCDKAQKSGIEDFGYGKGYTYLEEEFGRLLNLLNEVYGRGINIACTAHAAMRRVELPEETGAYDHWELKLEKKTASLAKEWADIILFCNYKTIVIKGANPMEKNKAAGGRRMMYTTHTPWWDAKNRFGLPEELPLEYSAIAPLFLYEQPAVNGTASAKVETATPPAPAPITASPAAAPPPKMPQPAETADEQLPFHMDDSPVQPLLENQYPGIPKAMADLAVTAGMTMDDIKRTLNAGGWYPKDTPVENMDPNFFTFLVSEWDKFTALWAKTKS
ncbi:MAG: ATP-binding protein [Clostridium sp.]|nr:ATP-binding protein [Clostridium sp.]